MSFVALATCLDIPEPDYDEPVLVRALEELGVAARVLAWDDPAAPWDDARLTIVRSTWNYYLRPEAFLAWVAGRRDRVRNPATVLRWNVHKRYLRDLEAGGVRIVPTWWLDRGASPLDGERAASLGWQDVVAKPAVSAGSYRTTRLRGAWWQQPALQDLVAGGDTMVQPYVSSVEDYGERSIIFIDGAITHAIRKSPRFEGDSEAVSGALPIADDERALAVSCIRLAPEAPLYARADIVRDAKGQVMLSELELLEPSLYLRQSSAACDRLARAIVRLAAG